MNRENTNIPFKSYEQMKSKAKKLLSDTGHTQYTQAIILFSAKRNEYCKVIKNALSDEKTDETELINKVNEAKDTEIAFVLCVWHNGCIDLPSFSFRKMLISLNEKNSETLLFVMTAGGISARKLSSTMK